MHTATQPGTITELPGQPLSDWHQSTRGLTPLPPRPNHSLTQTTSLKRPKRRQVPRRKAPSAVKAQHNQGVPPKRRMPPKHKVHLNQEVQPNHKVQHRIGAVMAHVPWYSFKSQARLAADLGFSKSAVSRLLRGECTPSLALACALTNTLEKRLGRKLELRELFTVDGTYPTPSACQLVGCANCLPPEAYDREDNLRPEYRDVPAGQWSIAPQQRAARDEPSQSRETPDTVSPIQRIEQRRAKEAR